MLNATACEDLAIGTGGIMHNPPPDFRAFRADEEVGRGDLRFRPDGLVGGDDAMTEVFSVEEEMLLGHYIFPHNARQRVRQYPLDSASIC